MRHRPLVAALAAALFPLAVPAHATAPGVNGVIGYEVPTSKGVGLYSVGVTGGEPQRLSSLKGVHTTVEFSPDGKRIAYAAGKGDKPFQIYVANADGSSPKRVTDGEFAISPSWSPDSKKIAYAAQTGPDLGGGRPSRVHVMNANGSGDHEVEAGGTPESANLTDPVWTPDGKRLVISVNTIVDDFDKSDFFLVAVKATGGKAATLAHRGGFDEFNPNVSPDGKTVVIEIAKKFALTQSDIATVPLKGGKTVRLTHGPAFETNPVWSPDGTRIALTSDRDAKQPGKERLGRGFELYTMAGGGGDFVRLTDDNDPNLFPDWQSLPAR